MSGVERHPSITAEEKIEPLKISINHTDRIVYINSARIPFPTEDNSAWKTFHHLASSPGKMISISDITKNITEKESLERGLQFIKSNILPEDYKEKTIEEQIIGDQIVGYKLNARIIVVKV